MEPKEFVTQMLAQILEGVRSAQAAQKKEDFSLIVPSMAEDSRSTNNHVIGYTEYGWPVILVDFDIAVSVEKSKAGGAGIEVLSFGGKFHFGKKDTATNRVRFSIPVALDTSKNPQALQHFIESAKQ